MPNVTTLQYLREEGFRCLFQVGRLSFGVVTAQAVNHSTYFSALTELPAPNHFSARALAAFRVICLEWMSPTGRPSLLNIV